MKKRWVVIVGLLAVAAVALALGLLALRDTKLVQGLVQDANGPVPGAVVRVQGDNTAVTTDAAGRFGLLVAADAGDADITAWAPGYFVGSAHGLSESGFALIDLVRYPTTDNLDYNWFSHEGAQGSLSCSHCMPCYDEWRADAHSLAAINPRFLSLYNGTTLTGQPGTPTTYAFDADLGIDVPVAPSQGQDGVGPGLRLDFPDLGGNCATCHMPGAAAREGGAYHVDIQTASGIDLEGVFCEFCHKVGDVRLDANQMPDQSLPGVLSMQLYRPEADQQIFFGNFDDVTRRVSYLPLIEESAFCASCHFGSFWGTVAYNSYGEWLDSPYSGPEIGQTCQDCHMPAVDYDYFVYPEQGGLIRDSERIFSHRMPGASDADLLHSAATLTVTTQREGDRLRVHVRVANTGAGHHLPTDNPLRNMILLVTATDADGQPLALASGPTISQWGGVGDPAQGHYAGLPGVLYAKILADFYTGETPSYTYWRQTRLVSDNRIPAFGADETTYEFTLPADAGAVTVDAQLWLRRAFQELMDLKHWNTPDMLMSQETVTVE
ncbi:MAG: hypothetical protein IT320_19765 [Anaerolineae bacterium]|nr:hypothetical protein [Anaerolineae bacterium]